MNDLTQTIISQINVLEGSLKNEKTLLEIFKRRLTKKELKLLKMQAKDIDEANMRDRLKLTQDRFQEMKLTLKKKLNSEKLKQEIAFV